MKNEKEIVLEKLEQLESFRKRLASGEISEGCSDWIVRMCQAHLAHGTFQNRIEWTEELELLKTQG